MKLLHPYFLFALLIFIPIIYNRYRKSKAGTPSLTISNTSAFKAAASQWRAIASHVAFALRLLAIGALIVAICRPQTHDVLSDSSVNGTDIVLALDVSESMLTPDMRPNRFEAARDIATDFAKNRNADNMALVAFAGESLTMMPLTSDRNAIVNAIANLATGSLGNGTALGDGLVTSINRLLNGTAVSKSVILLTDGSNNAGEVDPLAAASIAKEKSIRVYTIGIGTDQTFSVGSFFDPSATMTVPIDETTLSKIADTTGGKFFRATDNSTLKQVFKEIDSLEKSKLEVKNYTRTEEQFWIWVLIAFSALVLELVMRYTVLRRIP
jgi:Ca-activated chloride channel family protein